MPINTWEFSAYVTKQQMTKSDTPFKVLLETVETLGITVNLNSPIGYTNIFPAFSKNGVASKNKRLSTAYDPTLILSFSILEMGIFAKHYSSIC